MPADQTGPAKHLSSFFTSRGPALHSPGVGATTMSGWPSSSSSHSAHSCGSTPRSGVKQSQSPKGLGSSSCWPAAENEHNHRLNGGPGGLNWASSLRACHVATEVAHCLGCAHAA